MCIAAQKSKSKPRLQCKKAVVISEFLIVAPIMFILLFAIVEFCLWNIDRHLLTLASFEAAHDIVNSQADIEQICNRNISAEAAGTDIAKIRDRVAWTMAKKMAATSPSPADFLKNDFFSMSIPASDTPEANQDLDPSLGKVLLFILQRMPSAYILTSYTCRSLEGDVVQLEGTFLRSPKMPLMRNTLWALYVIEKSADKLKEAGIHELISMYLDRNFYDIKLQGHAGPLVREEIKKFRNDVATMKDEVKATKHFLSDQLLNFNIKIPDAVAEKFDFVDKFFSKVRDHQWLNEIEGAASNFDNLVNGTDFMSKVVYAVPEQFRLIPTKVSVMVARDTTNRDGESYEGNVTMLAPFDGRNSNWREWAKRMAGSTSEEKRNGLQ